MKKYVLSLLIIISLVAKAQDFNATSGDGLHYNNKKQLLEIHKVYEFGNLDDSIIFLRAVNWFADKFKIHNEEKFNTVLNSKNQKTYQIQGRYLDSYGLKKKEENSYIVICGQIDISIKNSKMSIKASSFRLPDFDFSTLEEISLGKNKSFQKPYRKIEENLYAKTTKLFENLQGWIENYDEFIKEEENWDE